CEPPAEHGDLLHCEARTTPGSSGKLKPRRRAESDKWSPGTFGENKSRADRLEQGGRREASRFGYKRRESRFRDNKSNAKFSRDLVSRYVPERWNTSLGWRRNMGSRWTARSRSMWSRNRSRWCVVIPSTGR